jgi:prepilin-type N-terminal cleavage/methylation domain-containing protein
MKSKHTGINIFNAAAGRFKQKEGYSLIEVLMAISILAVGMLAVASMQASGIRVNATASRITTRATWAQDRIETLMALPYSDPWLEQAGNSGGLDSNNNTHEVTTTDNYTISWVVANNNPVPNAKLITVTVTGYGGTTVLRAIKA